VRERRKYKENFFLVLIFAVFLFLMGVWEIYQAAQGRHTLPLGGFPMDTWQMVGVGIIFIIGAFYFYRLAIKEYMKNGEQVSNDKI
jgi:hypothetical protein